MDQFFKAFGESKLPTLLVLGLVYIIGAWLLVNSGKNPSATIPGYVILTFAGILTLISFFDYRNKEEVDRILKNNKQHYDGILDSYKSALTAISQTSTTAEHFKQENLSSSLPSETKAISYGNEEYSVESESSTQIKR